MLKNKLAEIVRFGDKVTIDRNDTYKTYIENIGNELYACVVYNDATEQNDFSFKFRSGCPSLLHDIYYNILAGAEENEVNDLKAELAILDNLDFINFDEEIISWTCEGILKPKEQCIELTHMLQDYGVADVLFGVDDGISEKLKGFLDDTALDDVLNFTRLEWDRIIKADGVLIEEMGRIYHPYVFWTINQDTDIHTIYENEHCHIYRQRYERGDGYDLKLDVSFKEEGVKVVRTANIEPSSEQALGVSKHTLDALHSPWANESLQDSMTKALKVLTALGAIMYRHGVVAVRRNGHLELIKL